MTLPNQSRVLHREQGTLESERNRLTGADGSSTSPKEEKASLHCFRNFRGVTPRNYSRYSLRPRRVAIDYGEDSNLKCHSSLGNSEDGRIDCEGFISNLLDSFENLSMDDNPISQRLKDKDSSSDQTSSACSSPTPSTPSDSSYHESTSSSDSIVEVSSKRRYPKTLTNRRRKLPRKSREVLSKWFESHKIFPYPTESERRQLEKSTGLGSKQVHHWFTNRRKRDPEWRKRFKLRGRGRQPKTARAEAMAAAQGKKQVTISRGRTRVTRSKSSL
mmetsp:Transcript_16406/g.24721  ORF Transcript_16406/g.24721 Transcript_16406/m.24721 type:complete len:274 (+) Transcript_16406:240-1061(+)